MASSIAKGKGKVGNLMAPMRIGMLGAGTVGGGVVEALRKNPLVTYRIQLLSAASKLCTIFLAV